MLGLLSFRPPDRNRARFPVRYPNHELERDSGKMFPCSSCHDIDLGGMLVVRPPAGEIEKGTMDLVMSRKVGRSG